jgi:excisionase family DNA binding protein
MTRPKGEARPQPNSSRKPRRLGTIQQAADEWGVGKVTIRRRIADGTLPGYRIPGTRSIRVDLDELDAALNRIPTTSGRGDAA